MKRIYISLAFFILSIATGIFEMFYVTNRIDELNEEIVSADNLVKSENYDGAKDVLAAAESKWQKNLSIFDILLIHDYVDEISVNLSAMRSYVATQSNDNYLAESAGIKRFSVPVTGELDDGTAKQSFQHGSPSGDYF